MRWNFFAGHKTDLSTQTDAECPRIFALGLVIRQPSTDLKCKMKASTLSSSQKSNVTWLANNQRIIWACRGCVSSKVKGKAVVGIGMNTAPTKMAAVLVVVLVVTQFSFGTSRQHGHMPRCQVTWLVNVWRDSIMHLQLQSFLQEHGSFILCYATQTRACIWAAAMKRVWMRTSQHGYSVGHRHVTGKRLERPASLKNASTTTIVLTSTGKFQGILCNLDQAVYRQQLWKGHKSGQSYG